MGHIFCTKCGAENPETNNFCQQCGVPLKAEAAPVIAQPQPAIQKKKLRGWQIALIVIGSVLVLFILGSALRSGSNPDAAVASVSSQAATQAQAKANAPANKTYAVGETAKINDLEMTLTKVEKSSGSDYDKPKDGHEFVIVTVKLHNTGSGTISYNPLYFKMQNSQGQINDETFSVVDQNTALQSGDLAPGGTVSGSVVFEEPKDDGNLVLKYQDDILSNGAKLQFRAN